MTELNDLKTYHDLKEIFDREVFTRAMTYVAWHNRLPMTHLLELWQAAMVGFLCRRREILDEQYHDIKDFLLHEGHRTPQTLADCESLAIQLETLINSAGKK
ncbi:MAG: hypothetical protein AAB305_00005 [Candidatus Zixiibacteriota bacterium]